MGYTELILDDVRAQLASDDAAIKEARERRDSVRASALKFAGTLRSFSAGSLAHATANCPVHQRDAGLDADSGVVLDRRTWTQLGPDSILNEGPTATVQSLRDHLQQDLAETYSSATFTITKRAILIELHQPLMSGEDPSVDLVMGLGRVSAAGLWIPNTETNDWDPSDPEKHTALLTAEPKDLRVTRARAIRLAKAENKRTTPAPLCSFNLEAFGLMFVEPGVSVAVALRTLWRRGAADLRVRLTPDPAKVSKPIKVEDPATAASRLDHAADCLDAALSRNHDESWVRSQLQPLWPDFVSPQSGGTTKARLVATTRSAGPVAVTSLGLLSTTSGTRLKRPQSFGDGLHQR